MRSGRYIIGLMVLLLVGCGHKAPQIPSQRKGQAPQADSAQLAMMELNRQMAQAADEQLAALVLAQEEAYALYDGNAWCTLLEKGDTDSPGPQEGEQWLIRLRTYNLRGELLLDSESTCRIGKQELPPAVEYNIGEWHRGCSVRMYVPWYSAYGMSGTAQIPPYENVIIELELK